MTAFLPEHAEIDLSTYPMPAFANLAVADLDRARRWYVGAVGFRVLAELPGQGGGTGLLHLRRFRYQDILVVRGDLDAPPSGMTYTFAGGGVDLDELVASATVVADEIGGSVEGPVQTPWNTRDVTFVDPDGYRITLTTFSMSDAPQFDARCSTR